MGEKITNAKIEVSVTRRYGVEDVTFAISYVAAVASRRELDIQYKWAEDEMHHQHERFSADTLPKVKAPSESLTNDGAGEWYPANEIVVEVKNGKRYYAVKGGKYEKHGVRVWDEVLKFHQLLTTMQENDRLALGDGWQMEVGQGDKGLKVMRLRKVDGGG